MKYRKRHETAIKDVSEFRFFRSKIPIPCLTNQVFIALPDRSVNIISLDIIKHPRAHISSGPR